MEPAKSDCSVVVERHPEMMESPTTAPPSEYRADEKKHSESFDKENVTSLQTDQAGNNSALMSQDGTAKRIVEELSGAVALPKIQPEILPPTPTLSLSSTKDDGVNQGKEDVVVVPPPPAPSTEAATNNNNNRINKATPSAYQTTTTMTTSSEVKSANKVELSSSSSSTLSLLVPLPEVAGTSKSYKQEPTLIEVVPTRDGGIYTIRGDGATTIYQRGHSRDVRNQNFMKINRSDVEKLALKQSKHNKQIEIFKRKLETLEELKDLNDKYVRNTRVVNDDVDVTIVVLKSKDAVFAVDSRDMKGRSYNRQVDRFLDPKVATDLLKIINISNQMWVRGIESNSDMKICRHRRKPLGLFLFEQYGITVASVKAMCFLDNAETSFNKVDGKWTLQDIDNLAAVFDSCEEGETVYLCSLGMQHMEQAGFLVVLKTAFDMVILARNRSMGIEGVFCVHFISKSQPLLNALSKWKWSLRNNGSGPKLLLDRYTLQRCIFLEKLRVYNTGLAVKVLEKLTNSVLLRCNLETQKIMKELEE